MPQKRKHSCHARQFGDQMSCVPCGLLWDVGDPEPPQCKRHDHRKAEVRAAFNHESQGVPCVRRLPEQLPPDVAAEMAKVYHANKRDGLSGQIAGMQAAYRLLLDRVEL